jgi:cystathionine beta-lyase
MNSDFSQEAQFDFDTPVDRRGTASMKWDKYKGRDILPLWVADMDFRSPPAVVQAIVERAEHGVFGYTLAPPELTGEVQRVLLQRFGWRVEAQWMVWLPGLVTGLNVACRAVGQDGDAVITAIPVYPPFLTAPAFSRRELISVPLDKTGSRWEYDFDRFEKAITPRTRLCILCNPHNPVGRVFSRKELSQLSEICERRDIVICSDEIHCDLILEPDKPHLPTALLSPDIADRTITLMAPSKTYNLPGLGCSLAIIPNAALRKQFKQAMAGIVPHVNALGYTAALAAYRHGDPWLADLLMYLRANRDRVAEAVAAMPGISATPVEATYLAWIDCRHIHAEDPVRFFEDAGVGLSDGREFSGAGYLRLNFGCSRSTLDEALRRMRVAIEKQRKGVAKNSGRKA